MIEAYGNGGFTIQGLRTMGSILVLANRSEAWPAKRFEDVTFESLSAVFNEEPAVDILLIGCGPVQVMAPGALRGRLREAGVIADFMNTGAACRTYNVLLSEDRRVAAALIAVE